MTFWTRFGRCQRGAAAVEFAIVSVVFITLLVAGFEFSRAMYVKNQLAGLADQAARQVLLDNSTTSGALETIVQNGFSAGDPTALTVTVTTLSGTATDFRVITVTYPLMLFIPNLTPDAIDLSIERRVPTG